MTALAEVIFDGLPISLGRDTRHEITDALAAAIVAAVNSGRIDPIVPEGKVVAAERDEVDEMTIDEVLTAEAAGTPAEIARHAPAVTAAERDVIDAAVAETAAEREYASSRVGRFRASTEDAHRSLRGAQYARSAAVDRLAAARGEAEQAGET